MIGKITTGSNFERLFRYLLKDNGAYKPCPQRAGSAPHKESHRLLRRKSDATPRRRKTQGNAHQDTTEPAVTVGQILGGDRLLLEPDARELASQFNWIASTRPTTKKPVKHISIGFAPADEKIDDSTKVAISEAVVNRLGYTNNQWIAIAHGRNDPGHDWQHHHDHIHIVINAIDFNGDRISDSFDKTRLEKILRALETEHDLTTVISSNVCDRQRPKTNQLNRYQRENREYVRQQRDAPPEIPIMAKLEAAIDVASRDQPTMTSFLGRMQQLGIDVRPYITKKERKGISYRLGDFQVRGSKVHNGSFPKLLSERGIDFDEIRDTPAIEAAYQGKPIYIAKQPFLSWEQIDLDYWLPKSLKALANTDLVNSTIPKTNPKQWENLQQKLLNRYGIPQHISAGLNEASLLGASEKGEPIWHKRSILGSKDSHFWFEINSSGARVKKMVLTNSPVEAVSAYLVDRLVNQEDSPCLYLSLERSEQLKELDLTKFDTVVVNSNDKKLVSDSVPNSVVKNNVNNWQPTWLNHWNEMEMILGSKAKNNSTSLQRQTSHTSKQLEL